MGQRSELFDTCKAVLQGEAPESGVRDDADRLLARLGYVHETDRQQGSALSNRCALLGLAARFEDSFVLPAPYAPGVSLFGALVSPDEFGLAAHGSAPVGTGGRGLALRQAFESCIGETAEYLSFLEHESDPLIERTPAAMPSNAVTDWELTGLGLNRAEAGKVTDWVQARSLIGGEVRYFPSELVLRRPEHRRTGRREAESTGVGAGPTIDDAVASGLMEAIERDAVALWWFGGRPARSINPDGDLQDHLDAARQGDTRRTWFLDLTTDLEVPVVAALSCDDAGAAVIAGFSAHAQLETAARQALLELCQMELAQYLALYKQENMGDDALQDMDRTWIERSQHLTIEACPQFTPEASAPDAASRTQHIAADLTEVTHHLHRRGYTPFMVDLTRTDIGINVVRVLIPGLQSAKPDWVSERLRATAKANGIDVVRNSTGPALI